MPYTPEQQSRIDSVNKSLGNEPPKAAEKPKPKDYGSPDDDDKAWAAAEATRKRLAEKCVGGCP